MPVIVECKNVSFTYQNGQSSSLSDIDWQINAGDFILCTGPTGCGKSTLLKAFNGLIPHEISGTLQGSILVNGRDSLQSSVAELSRSVSLMFQNPDDQVFSTSIADEVGFALENLEMEPVEIRRRVSETLAWVGLAGREQTSVHALSGGERQRLALAAVLAIRPQVLALDEPISQMDPRGASELLQVLQRLNEEQGITVIVVEHRLHEVMPICKRVVVLDQGRLAWQGTQREAFSQPEVFLRLGLRIPQTVHICHRLGLAVENATVDAALSAIRNAYPCCGATTQKEAAQAEAPPQPVIEIQGLEFRYERAKGKVLDEVHLILFRGQFVALMGNNGAGKSTLLHHICGLLQAQKGQVKLLGKPVTELDRRVGMVMQNPDLMLFNPTVEREVTFGLQHGMGRGKERENWRPLLARIGLDGMEERFPLALSQGQRVRVAIASLLACQPDVMLLDEPTTGQDLSHIDDIIGLLQEYTQTGGTVLFCTHDTEVAARYAQRVVIMTTGRIVADASPREVFSRDETLLAAGLRPPASLQLSRRLYEGCALGVEEVVRHVQQASLGSYAG